MIEYVEVTLEDIETANHLSHETLGKSLDELPPQTRKLLTLINDYVKVQCQAQGIKVGDFRFSRRHIREVTGWSDGQLKIHCSRLEDMEYLLVERGGRGKLIEYELLYDGELNTGRHLMGLIDIETLKKNYDYGVQKLGQKVQKIAPSQGQVRVKLAPSQTNKIKPQLNGHKVNEDLLNEADENGQLEAKKNKHHNIKAVS